MNGDLYAELRMLSREVSIGLTTSGLICPKCRGGRTGERSLSITRVDAARVAYCCHRGSCGFDGYLGRSFGHSFSVEHHNGDSVDQGTPQFQGRPFLGDVRLLGDAWLSELCGNYGFTVEETSQLGWLEETAFGRLVVPIRGPLGQSRGVHLRANLSARKSGRKSWEYPEIDEAWVGWWRPTAVGSRDRDSGEATIVLVEDVLSAAKVSLSGFVAVSLMGSHLSLDTLTEVQEQGYKHIVLALDRDATSKAIRLAARWGFIASGLRVMVLDRDLKYETKAKIREMVTGVIT